MNVSSSDSSNIWKSQECTICLNPLTPPIYQCYNGHVLCSTCENKLRTCPVCRMTLPKGQKIRNRAMENIIVSTRGLNEVVECNNAHLGCSVKLFPEQMNHHEPVCKYNLIPLCRKLGLTCNDESNYFNFAEHLRTHGIRGTDLTGVKNPEIEICRRLCPADMIVRQRLCDQTYIKTAEAIYFLMSSVAPNGLIKFNVLVSSWGKTCEKYTVSVRVKAKELGETWTWEGKPVPLDGLLASDHLSFVIWPSILSHLESGEQVNPAVITWTVTIRLNRQPVTNLPILPRRLTGTTWTSVIVATMAITLPLLLWATDKHETYAPRNSIRTNFNMDSPLDEAAKAARALKNAINSVFTPLS